MSEKSSYPFNGIDIPRVFQELDLRDAQSRRRPRTRLGRAARWFFSLGSLSLMGIGALIGVVLVLLSTPDARADTAADNTFLSVLAAEGFTYDHTKTAVIISNGHRVCELLIAGAAPFDIVTAIDQVEPRIDRNEAAEFAALANAVYCPQFGTGVQA